jgi:cobalt-zinc-cadmium efflux system protein
MHDHSHGHSHFPSGGKKRMLFTVGLNLIITIAEIIGGLMANSLALLSDALHNLSDTAALFIAWVAMKISGRESTERMTFGYRRIEILAALFNSVVLIGISIFLIYESIHRFRNPEPVEGSIMFWVALIGLAANLLSVVILHKNKSANLNIRAAYLHLLGDTLSSVVVIAGGLLILFFDIYWVDPLVTVLISLYIAKETYSVLRETIDILMQSAPPGLDAAEIKQELEKFEEVDNIHHIHLWSLDDRSVHFECHCDIGENVRISRADEIRQKLENFLLEKFDIQHVTIQIEYNICHSKGAIAQRRENNGCE